MAKTNPAQFVRQVRQEINRITWATKRETLYASLSVFVMALIASLFFLLVDLLLSNIVQFLLGLWWLTKYKCFFLLYFLIMGFCDGQKMVCCTCIFWL